MLAACGRSRPPPAGFGHLYSGVMSAPWHQFDDEPVDAFAAFVGHHTLRRHLETSPTNLLADSADSQHSEWAQVWEWDQRCAAWDAETERRRAVTAGQAMNEAANSLVIMASAHISLSQAAFKIPDPGNDENDNGEPPPGVDLAARADVLRSLRETLQAGCAMFEQSLRLINDNSIVVQAPQPPRLPQTADPDGRSAAAAAAAERIAAGRRQEDAPKGFRSWKPEDRVQSPGSPIPGSLSGDAETEPGRNSDISDLDGGEDLESGEGRVQSPGSPIPGSLSGDAETEPGRNGDISDLDGGEDLESGEGRVQSPGSPIPGSLSGDAETEPGRNGDISDVDGGEDLESGEGRVQSPGSPIPGSLSGDAETEPGRNGDTSDVDGGEDLESGEGPETAGLSVHTDAAGPSDGPDPNRPADEPPTGRKRRLQEPTPGPRCGRQGGKKDHTERGEYPCKKCDRLSSQRKQRRLTVAPDDEDDVDEWDENDDVDDVDERDENDGDDGAADPWDHYDVVPQIIVPPVA